MGLRFGSTKTFGIFAATFLVTGCTMLSGADDLGTVDAPPAASKINANGGADKPSPPSSTTTGRNTTDTNATSPATTTTPASPAPPAPPAPNVSLMCDGFTCEGATPFCCEFPAQRGQCTATAAECLNLAPSTVAACHSAADCSNGDVCCADAQSRTAQCGAAASCGGAAKKMLCKGDSDCVSGQKCTDMAVVFDWQACQ